MLNLKKISDYIWEIPREEGMKVVGRIFASKKILEFITKDNSINQVKNVASLPGILNYSIAMPDIHEGYGFPIGGVAAVDINEGYISPGGVGYDINCGVRLLSTNLYYNDVKNRIDTILSGLFTCIPSGVGSKNAIKKLSEKEFFNVLKKGGMWAVENGFGNIEDLMFTEDSGCIENEGYKFVSKRAVERGRSQLGTLGSGNHFLEIDIVEKIFNKDFAEKFGLFKGQLIIIFHTGSRGFGYQVCDDFLKIMRKNIRKFHYIPPDMQLIAIPFKSDIGQQYFNCMNAAANYAWANRQIIKALIEETFLKILKISPSELQFKQIYDVTHNMAKVEKFKNKDILIHRKGATRALADGSEKIPLKYKNMGQPIIIPGDMGTGSYLLVGCKEAEISFFSCCHGAGRLLSRKKALKKFSNNEVIKNLQDNGISILAKNKRTIVEEMPDAYKDIDDVVNVVEEIGIARKVVKFKPVAVMKG